MFGFISNIVYATVKVAVTPLAVVKDIVEAEPFETTSDLLESAVDDVSEAFDDLME